jgi:hypothetical protein
MSYAAPFKDPDEVLDYDIDWRKRLAGDSIVTSLAILDSGDVTIESQDFLEGVQKLWLSGGTVGTTSLITVRITTLDGRTMEESVKIKIKAK